jgi:uncharacterized protein (TIGR03437 family)
MPRTKCYNVVSLLAFCAAFARLAAAAVPDRIIGPIDVTQIRTVAGNSDRLALPQFDRGAVDPAMPMNYMMLVVQPSAAQQAELNQLLADQQNPSSPLYRQWLTPEDFGNRFGLSPSDHSKVVAWLTSQGFTVNQSGRARNWIAFSGTAGQVSRALHTGIHRFQVNGETHYANTADPSVPEALAGVIGGFIGLSDFHPRPLIGQVSPEYNSGGSHYLAPQDWATIYDVSPLYSAGFNGAGQTIAVVGESDVPVTDIRSFRTRFGLPANDPKMVLYGGADPGTNSTQIEGDLDLEWAGAIAPNATIYYIYGADAFTAMVYAIDLNTAPVITVSYGGCEIGWRLSYWRAIAQQANAQGITILNSSGDSGAAGCDPQDYLPYAAAGRMVDFPAVLPEVTGVGGTQFVEGTGTYWATVNSANYGSALSYIPEAAWNESSASGLLASGGGASVLYAKPVWQTGPGVPNDNARDVPDVAFSAAGHDGYFVTYNGASYIVSGTSASSPSMAGLVAVLNQYQVSKGVQAQAGLGNINPQLYRLAQTAPTAFHDVTAGNNVVNCAQGSPDCLTGSFGYPTGAGYDMATGLGSVDAYNLVTQWNTQTAPVNVSLYLNTVKTTLNDTVGMTATVTAAAPGAATPTGTVAFSVNGIALGTSTLRTVSGQQEADLFFPAYLIGGSGTYTLVAQYSGNTAFSGGGVTRSIQITLPTAAAAIVSSGPDTVWPAAPDAQGLSWSTTLSLREAAGISALVTGFSIDGAAQPLAQYFPSPAVPASSTVTTTVVQRNLATPSTHTFGFTGTDVNGNTWSRQITVNYLALPPGSVSIVTATPLVVARNPDADPSCQWSIQLNVDEAGGNVGLEETNLIVGGVDWSSRITALFGTPRLAPWAGLQGTICLGGAVATPASETIQLITSGLTQELTVSLVDPAANPTELSVTPASATMISASGSAPPLAVFAIDPGDPKATWTASVFPANRTTAWLGASQFSGTGPTQVALTASGVGFEPGVYRATLAIQSANAVPQSVSIPIMFVLGDDSSGAGIAGIANPAAYSASVSPGMVVAVYGANLANTTDSATASPLQYSLDGVTAAVNGIAAPVVYVSPTQINIQIPYEAGAGPAVLGIDNNGQITGFQFAIAASAPGIYADAGGNLSPTPTVAQGGTTTLYVNGAGDVAGLIRTGYAPPSSTAANYTPLLPVSVTVGGAPAFLQSVGLMPNQFGVTQVKFTLPASVAAGVQPVVVTVGGVSSPPVNVTVQ